MDPTVPLGAAAPRARSSRGRTATLAGRPLWAFPPSPGRSGGLAGGRARSCPSSASAAAPAGRARSAVWHGRENAKTQSGREGLGKGGENGERASVGSLANHRGGGGGSGPPRQLWRDRVAPGVSAASANRFALPAWGSVASATFRDADLVAGCGCVPAVGRILWVGTQVGGRRGARRRVLCDRCAPMRR